MYQVLRYLICIRSMYIALLIKILLKYKCRGVGSAWAQNITWNVVTFIIIRVAFVIIES